MSKKLSFNQWRKNWLNVGWIVIICGVIGLLIGIIGDYSGSLLNIGLVFLILFGVWAVYQSKQL